MTERWIIDNERYAISTEFESITEAECCVRGFGDEFKDVRLYSPGGDWNIYDQDDRIVGYRKLIKSKRGSR